MFAQQLAAPTVNSLLPLPQAKKLPQAVFESILDWTAGHRELTQQLCQLARQRLGATAAAEQVEELVTYFIANWEQQPPQKHLQQMRDRLLNSQQCEPFGLLRSYQQILQQNVAADGSDEQNELLNLGLVVEHEELTVANRIYRLVFNEQWIEEALFRLRPYDQMRLQLEHQADCPYAVLEEILVWTNRHPLLTRTLCQLVCDGEFIALGTEAVQVQQTVHARMLENWQQGAAAAHLKHLQEFFLSKDSEPLLNQYAQILQQEETPAVYNQEQQELLKLGLLDVHRGDLVVYNPIYEEVFNLEWVKQIRTQINQRPPNDKAKRSPSVKLSLLSFCGEILLFMLLSSLVTHQALKIIRSTPVHSVPAPTQNSAGEDSGSRFELAQNSAGENSSSRSELAQNSATDTHRRHYPF